jgi:hypothetical protein
MLLVPKKKNKRRMTEVVGVYECIRMYVYFSFFQRDREEERERTRCRKTNDKKLNVQKGRIGGRRQEV